MITEYIRKAMEQARYELIKDREPYYGCISVLKGVWATGKTLEDCRRNLEEVLEGWLVVRLQQRLRIPPVQGTTIGKPQKIKS